MVTTSILTFGIRFKEYSIPHEVDERTIGIRHIEKLKEYGLKNDLILFDRGYPSKDFIAYLYENNINFVMRVSGSFIKEVNSVKENDDIVEFEHKGKLYKLRVIKVILEN